MSTPTAIRIARRDPNYLWPRSDRMTGDDARRLAEEIGDEGLKEVEDKTRREDYWPEKGKR